MAKPITVARRCNEALAARLTEQIQAIVDEAEAESAWATYTLEFAFEGGKFRTVRQVTNRTWRDGSTGPTNGKVLTSGPPGA